jgi:putative Mg2+ transporter-C (MgtC) family protein
MLKYIRMTASSNFGNVFSVLVASAFLPFLPMLPLHLLVQNLLYDISQIAIPFDNVDEELVRKPLKWNPADIGRFMVFFGPISSIFDLTCFALMWYVFDARTPADQGLFQSGWFVVGLLTQTLIVHMIRTPKVPFLQSIAAPPLLLMTGLIMAIGVALPMSPLAGYFKLQACRRLLAVPGGDPVRLCGADHRAEEVLHPSLRLAVSARRLSREKHNGHQSEPAGVQRRRNLSSLISLSVAFVLGTAIGLERQLRQRTAGLRTNTLVAVGAAVFVDLAVRFHDLYGGPPSPLHVVAYVISGVGFLGAGAIMKDGAQVSGLNTAATLWGSAAVGACAGIKLLPEAVLAAVFVLAANTLLRPVVNRIQRQPLPEAFSEATYAINVVCQREQQAEVLDQLLLLLEQAQYPVRAVDQRPFGERDVEIEAVLYATTVDAGVSWTRCWPRWRPRPVCCRVLERQPGGIAAR